MPRVEVGVASRAVLGVAIVAAPRVAPGVAPEEVLEAAELGTPSSLFLGDIKGTLNSVSKLNAGLTKEIIRST